MDETLLRQVVARHPQYIMPPYDGLLGLDGFDAICAFSDFYGGSTIYVPFRAHIFKHCIEQAALREFDGKNYRWLSQKYKLSESHLRKLLR